MVVESSPPPVAPPSDGAPQARRARRTARACDALLVLGVLAFACWTVGYHACLLLGLDSSWALGALAAGLVPCGLLAARHEAGGAPVADAGRRSPDAAVPPPRGGRPPLAAAAAAIGLAVAAAVALALSAWPWAIRWTFWVAAAVAVVLAGRRGALAVPGGTRTGSGAAPRVGGGAGGAGAAPRQAQGR